METGNKKTVRLTAAAFAALAAYAILLHFKKISFSSGTIEFYPYIGGITLEGLLPAVPAAALIWWAIRKYGTSGWRPLAALTGVSFAFSAAIAGARPFPLEEIVLSPAATSYYNGLDIPLSSLLPDCGKLSWLAPKLHHMYTNMAGKSVLYHAIGAIWKNPAFIAYSIMLLSCLAAIPVYRVARLLLKDEKTALLAAAFYLFSPGRMYFIPSLNTLTPILFLAALEPLARYFESGKTLWAAVFGAAVYALVFFEPTPFAALAAFGLIFLLCAGHRLQTASRLLWGSLAAFTVIHILMKFILAYDIFSNFWAIYLQNQHTALVYPRTYWRWLFKNPFDYLLSAGIGASICMAAWMYCRAKEFLRGPQTAMEFLRRPDIAAGAAFLLSFLILDFSSTAGGEAARIWIFLTPFVSIFAARYCAAETGPDTAAALIAISALQATATMPVVAFIIP